MIMTKLITTPLALLLIITLAAGALAAPDYTFRAVDNDNFYRSTLYEDMFSTQYNYSGPNVTDFIDLEAYLPGLYSQWDLNDISVMDAIPDFDSLPADYSGYDIMPLYYDGMITETTFTDASTLKRSDGSIGALIIPKLNINMKVYEGTGSASMAKGVGHFPDSSGWNGNISLCGHNRGAKYTIGGIRNLKQGDIIKYTTTLGTRTYKVTFVGTIANDDWSYVERTADNKITLITCLANQPSVRMCVQAVQV
jgi:LPXTG-site transpeptidase (sortase) family protein